MKQKILEKCKRALMLLLALAVLVGTVPAPKAEAAGKYIRIYFKTPDGYSLTGTTYFGIYCDDETKPFTLKERGITIPQVTGLPANKEVSGWTTEPNIGTLSNSGLANKKIYPNKVNGYYITLTPVISYKKYTVSFIRDGYTFSSKKVTYGKTVARPSEPTRKDYIFIDWYQDANLTTKFNFNTKITKNTRVYAKYISASIKFTGEKKTKTVEEENTFSLNPESYQNGTNDTTGWKWDKKFFEADFSSKPTFKAIKAGKTKITYTNSRKQKATITITIKAKPVVAAVDPQPDNTVDPDPTGGGNDKLEKGIMFVWMGAAAVVMLLGAVFIFMKLREKQQANFKSKMVPVTGDGQAAMAADTQTMSDSASTDNSFAEMDKAVAQSNILGGGEVNTAVTDNAAVSEAEAAAVVGAVGVISQPLAEQPETKQTQVLDTPQKKEIIKPADSVTAFEKLQADILQAKSVVENKKGNNKTQSAQAVAGFMSQIDSIVEEKPKETETEPAQNITQNLQTTQPKEPAIQPEEIEVPEVLGAADTKTDTGRENTEDNSADAVAQRRGPVIWATQREGKAQPAAEATQTDKTVQLRSVNSETQAEQAETDTAGQIASETAASLESVATPVKESANTSSKVVPTQPAATKGVVQQSAVPKTENMSLVSETAPSDELEIDFQLGEFGSDKTQVLTMQSEENTAEDEISSALDNFDMQNQITQSTQEKQSPFGQRGQLNRVNNNRTGNVFAMGEQRQLPNRQQQRPQQVDAVRQQAIAVGQSQVAGGVQNVQPQPAYQPPVQNNMPSNPYGGNMAQNGQNRAFVQQRNTFAGQNSMKTANRKPAANQPDVPQPEDDILQGQIEMMIQSRKQNVTQPSEPKEVVPQQSHNVMKQVENPLANTLQQLVQEEQQVVVKQKNEIEKEVEQKQKAPAVEENQNQTAAETTQQVTQPVQQQENNNKKPNGKKKRNRKKKKGKKK